MRGAAAAAWLADVTACRLRYTPQVAYSRTSSSQISHAGISGGTQTHTGDRTRADSERIPQIALHSRRLECTVTSKKLSRRWQTARRISAICNGVADPLETRFPDVLNRQVSSF